LCLQLALCELRSQQFARLTHQGRQIFFGERFP